MLIGEMSLLVAAVLIMTGLLKKITQRLYVNDYIATFLIFLIVFLNVRGGIRLTNRLSLHLGGVLSILVSIYAFFRRNERFSDVFLGILTALAQGGIAFSYSLVFLASGMSPALVGTMLSLLGGIWCAISAKRTFASCLFSSVTGSFVGITLYQLFITSSGELGGGYAFQVMWLTAIAGLALQYLFSFGLRASNTPRADVFFEAGEMREKEDQEGSSGDSMRKKS